MFIARVPTRAINVPLRCYQVPPSSPLPLTSPFGKPLTRQPSRCEYTETKAQWRRQKIVKATREQHVDYSTFPPPTQRLLGLSLSVYRVQTMLYKQSTNLSSYRQREQALSTPTQVRSRSFPS